MRNPFLYMTAAVLGLAFAFALCGCSKPATGNHEPFFGISMSENVDATDERMGCIYRQFVSAGEATSQNHTKHWI